MTGEKHCFGFVFAQPFPGQVVERTARQRNPPVGHCTTGIDLNGLAKTCCALLMIEPIDPDKPPIKPALGLWMRCSDPARVRAQFEGIVHLALLIRC